MSTDSPASDRSLPGRILLVDDEQEFADILAERFRIRKMPVEVAYNGEAALALIEAGAPDVAVLDLKMPGMDGLELLGRIKKKHPDIQVIILTGHGDEEDAVIARELGAFAFLKKPCDFSELKETILNSIRRGGAGW